MRRASDRREPSTAPGVQDPEGSRPGEEQEPDARLIARSQNGEVEAFGELVEAYQDRIYHTILRLVGQREEASDLAQETFLKAFRALASFRGESRFYTWLCRIAINTAISARRKVALHGKPISLQAADGDGGGQASFDPPARDGDPTEALGRKEATGRVRAAIAALDEPYRLVVVLKDLEERSHEEIAGILGIPVGTVKSRLHRARLELKERLKDLW